MEVEDVAAMHFQMCKIKQVLLYIWLLFVVPGMALDCYQCVMSDTDGIEKVLFGMTGLDLNSVSLDPSCGGPPNANVVTSPCPGGMECGMVIMTETGFVMRGCIPDLLCEGLSEVHVDEDVWIRTICCAGDLCNTMPSSDLADVNSGSEGLPCSAWSLAAMLVGLRCAMSAFLSHPGPTSTYARKPPRASRQ